MGLREDLTKKIERKRQEIADLEGQIREANSYIQALEDTLKLLPREGANEGRAALFLRPHSSVAKARDVLKKANKPLHVNEILSGIGKPQDRANRSGLNSSLSMYVRKREIFTRPAPNTYGLIEFDVTSADGVVLPDDFGTSGE